MQFYEFFKSLLDYMPPQFQGVQSFLSVMLPYVLMACALFTSFFGLKCAGMWCATTFFFLGSAISSRLILPGFSVYSFEYWLLFGVCISIGLVCAYFSKYLFRVQLLASMFVLVYAALPPFISFFGDIFSRIISLIVAAALAFLTVKYKYILVIATTAFSGSFIFWGVAEEQFGIKLKLLLGILMGVVALAFQCINSIDKLLDTYDDVKKKYEITSKESKKAYGFVKGKMEDYIEHNKDDSSEEESVLIDEE